MEAYPHIEVCKNCKHFEKAPSPLPRANKFFLFLFRMSKEVEVHKLNFAKCISPRNPIKQVTYCSVTREKGLCGPEASWYEER